MWGPRVRDTTAGHSTAADLVPLGARVQDGRRPCKTSGGRMDGTVTLAGNQKDGFELEKGSLRGEKKLEKVVQTSH